MFSNQLISKLFFTALFGVFAALMPVQALTSAGQQGPISCPAPTPAAPVWGKLVVSGNSVTCFYATGAATPTVWTQIGVPRTTDFINNPVLVGIYITAHDSTGPSTVSTGTIDNFSITPAPTYQLMDYDIGSPSLMGSANLISGVWNIAGSGKDIWGTSDQFNFQSWLVWGDCTIICRVTSLLASGSTWEKMGIMVRDGFNSGSDYASFCATNGNGILFQYRLSFNDNPDLIDYVAPPAPGVQSSVSIGYGLTGGTTYTLRP